jgi:hypothetical protein
MESDDTTTTDQQSGEESVEDFKQEVEDDPATANEPGDDNGFERIRGG